MKEKRFGRTEVMVSEVGCGSIPLMGLKFDDAVRIVRHAYEQGMTFFETGHSYQDAEDKVGEAIQPFRDKIFLASKTLARDGEKMTRHIEHSLKRLRTSYLDLYQLHYLQDVDGALAAGGTYEALDKARAEGKIRFIGIACHDTEAAIKAAQTGLFDTVQIAFNFIETEVAQEAFKIFEEQGMGIIGMKPFGGGLLGRADLCIKFLQQYPQVLPIPGFRSAKEIDEVVGLYRSPTPLSDTQLKEIEEIRDKIGTKFCHRCEYCMPCEQGVAIPYVMLFKHHREVWDPETLVAFQKDKMKSVEDCIDCEECVEKCPYDLPIPDLLRENLALYKEYLKEHGIKEG